MRVIPPPRPRPRPPRPALTTVRAAGRGLPAAPILLGRRPGHDRSDESPNTIRCSTASAALTRSSSADCRAISASRPARASAAPPPSAPRPRSPPAPQSGQPAARPHQHQNPPRPPRSTANTISSRKSRTTRQCVTARASVEARDSVTQLPNTYAAGDAARIAGGERANGGTVTPHAARTAAMTTERSVTISMSGIISTADESHQPRRGQPSVLTHVRRSRTDNLRANTQRTSRGPSMNRSFPECGLRISAGPNATVCMSARS